MPDAFSTEPYPSPESFAEAQSEARREKTYAAERSVNQIRAAVIVFNSVLWAFFLDTAGSIPWMAWSVIGVANAYWIIVELLEPYRRFEVMLSSYFTSLTDAVLITIWVWGTGGFASPFYVVWYVSVVAIAFRYGLRDTVWAAGLYTVCYVGLLAGIGELAGNVAETTVRAGYIFLVGSLGGLVSKEATHQTEEKVRMRGLMESARAAEERFRRLLESAPDAILIVGGDGQVVVGNTQAEHLFGMDRQELLDQHLDRIVPTLAEAVGLEDGSGSNGQGLPSQPVEAIARRKDGGRVSVEVSVAPMATAEGQFLSCILRDVTDRERTARELERRNQELARSNAELQQFAYVASHDLQEPLRMVSSYVQLLERRYGDRLDEDGREFIAYATEGVQRMHSLIRDLLSFSQVGRGDLETEPVDASQVVDEVLRSLQPSIDLNGAEIEVEPLPTVMADRAQLVQVFQNLISNAVKFHGDAPPRVRVWAQRDGNEWVFHVEDDGIGIEPEYQHKVFVIFQRLHDRQAYPGTGIGLSICKKIIEAHGGKIWFDSPPESSENGRGTVFHFSLPVLRTEQDGEGEPLGHPVSSIPDDPRGHPDGPPRTRLSTTQETTRPEG